MVPSYEIRFNKRRKKDRLTNRSKKIHNLCKRVRENKGSSPSGRHCGHYKAISNDEYLMSVIFSVIDFSLQTNYVPDRWKTVHHTILEKVKNSPKIHKLRNIWIIEADLNFMMSHVWGIKLTYYAESRNIVIHEQYGGRRNIRAQSLVLNNICSYNNSNIMRIEVAHVEMDATNCYNIIIPDQ